MHSGWCSCPAGGTVLGAGCGRGWAGVGTRCLCLQVACHSPERWVSAEGEE